MSRMTNLIYSGNYFGEINALAARRALAEGLEAMSSMHGKSILPPSHRGDVRGCAQACND